MLSPFPWSWGDSLWVADGGPGEGRREGWPASCAVLFTKKMAQDAPGWPSQKSIVALDLQVLSLSPILCIERHLKLGKLKKQNKTNLTRLREANDSPGILPHPLLPEG